MSKRDVYAILVIFDTVGLKRLNFDFTMVSHIFMDGDQIFKK